MYCMKCGAEIAEAAEFCSKCGAKISFEENPITTDAPTAPQVITNEKSTQGKTTENVIHIRVDQGKHMSDQSSENTFLNEKGIIVTNARFILPKHTFAMSGITSVQNHEVKPSRVGPIAVLIIGVLFLAGGESMIPIAGIMIIIGGLWFRAQKTTHHVLLHTSSGEAKALSSNDEEWVSKVIHALNDAIIHRG